MPAKNKKTPAKKKSVVSSSTRAKRFNLRTQTRLTKVLLALLVILLVTILGTLVFDRMKSNDLKAKAAGWTNITPPGADAGIKFVACKKPLVTAGQYDVTIVAAKDSALKLTRRDADDKPLSSNPPMPQVYTATYAKSTKQIKKGYQYEWSAQLPLQTVGSSSNVWWANEVTATKLSNRSNGSYANGSDRLLVYGMSDKANAPTFRKSGSGQVFVTGGFNGLPPTQDNYETASAYRQARAAWESKAPTVSSLVTCN